MQSYSNEACTDIQQHTLTSVEGGGPSRNYVELHKWRYNQQFPWQVLWTDAKEIASGVVATWEWQWDKECRIHRHDAGPCSAETGHPPLRAALAGSVATYREQPSGRSRSYFSVVNGWRAIQVTASTEAAAQGFVWCSTLDRLTARFMLCVCFSQRCKG